MRSVPAYENALKDAFERCLDLYLCPRVRKKRVSKKNINNICYFLFKQNWTLLLFLGVPPDFGSFVVILLLNNQSFLFLLINFFFQINIDPESLKPKLPSRKELRPYPTTCYLEYRGHKDAVMSISIVADGQWIASGMNDIFRDSIIFIHETKIIVWLWVFFSAIVLSRFVGWNCSDMGSWNRKMSQSMGSWGTCEVCSLESFAWASDIGCCCVRLMIQSFSRCLNYVITFFVVNLLVNILQGCWCAAFKHWFWGWWGSGKN